MEEGRQRRRERAAEERGEVGGRVTADYATCTPPHARPPRTRQIPISRPHRIKQDAHTYAQTPLPHLQTALPIT